MSWWVLTEDGVVPVTVTCHRSNDTSNSQSLNLFPFNIAAWLSPDDKTAADTPYAPLYIASPLSFSHSLFFCFYVSYLSLALLHFCCHTFYKIFSNLLFLPRFRIHTMHLLHIPLSLLSPLSCPELMPGATHSPARLTASAHTTMTPLKNLHHNHHHHHLQQ